MNLLYFLESPFQVQLCFDKIIENLEQKVLDQSSENFYRNQSLLKDILLYPELRNGITDIEQITQNEELIRRLLIDFFPPGLDLNEIKAVSMPYASIIFNQSTRFRNILKAAGPDFQINIRDFTEHQFYVSCCCIILNEFYGTNLSFTKPLFYEIPAANGIIKYYRILYNGDFMDIQPTGKSQTFTQADIDRLVNSYDDLELWKEKFPPDSWVSKGFALMTLVDVTAENAVSILKEKLLGRNDAGFRESIESIFQSIFLICDIKVGFTVYNEREGKFGIETFGQHLPSYVLHGESDKDIREILCPDSYHNLIEKQTYFSVSDSQAFLIANPDNYLAQHLLSQNIQSFILAPIVKNQHLFGLLEVVSPKKTVLNSITANKLLSIMPLLTDTIERLVNELQNEIQAVIQDKYTTIHDSVYWKFYNEARRYILDSQRGKNYELHEIAFSEVHPLYGQIDIKGSSEMRNSSIQKDLQKQLRALITVLQELRKLENTTDFFQQEEQQLEEYYQDLFSQLKSSTELYVNNYLDAKVHVLLRKMTNPDMQSAIEAYFAETSKISGSFHTYRRKYEVTMSSINNKMAGIIDSRQTEAQLLFPHYYERFVTDGVEHNLYIGASISPKNEYDASKLHDLRFWQLRVLCEMEIAHHHLKPSLPYPLDVTTLVLVYHSTIGIRFRMDEKRFDFDGSYNARFEIVKKRIDKAYVKGTMDRISQAGKLTIVYSSGIEEKEYIQYLQTLQSMHLLENGIEKLEVEDLQGVSGLKVLRALISHNPQL